MEDLTVELVMAVHTRIIERDGGDSRIISEANLHQMVFRANLIPECIPRAAFIFYSLCAYPAFREGNSGTALAVTELVLASGGYRITGEKRSKTGFVIIRKIRKNPRFSDDTVKGTGVPSRDFLTGSTGLSFL